METFVHPAYEYPWVMGLRLDRESVAPTLFFVQYGEDLLPLGSKGRLLAALSLDSIPLLLQSGGLGTTSGPIRVDGIYDVPAVLSLIRSGQLDVKWEVANCINFLFDCIAVSSGEILFLYQQVLTGLADCATFTTDLSEYLDCEPGIRPLASEAVVWCLGWVLLHLTFVA